MATFTRQQHDCGAVERQREAAEWRAIELKRQVDQQMDELRILANALRNEMQRRKAAEAKALRLRSGQALPREEEIVPALQAPARAWKSLDGMAPAELLGRQGKDRRIGTLAPAGGGDIERELEANFAALAAVGIEILIASPAAKTKKFHRASCASTRRFDDGTRIVFTSTREAEAAGYERCRVCFR